MSPILNIVIAAKILSMVSMVKHHTLKIKFILLTQLETKPMILKDIF